MPVDERIGRAVGLRPTVLPPPGRMTLHEQGFDSLPILAGLQFEIPYPPRDIRGGVQVGMGLEATDHATKGMLIRAIGPVGIVAHTALLRRIRALDSGCLYTPFGGVPGDLLRNMREVGSTHRGIHGSGLVLHRGNGKLLIGDLCALVLGKAPIHRPVDLLFDMPDEALPTLAARRGKLFDPFLFQALAQFRLAAALLPVALLSFPQLAVECPVVLAVAGGEKVGDAHVYPNHRGV